MIDVTKVTYVISVADDVSQAEEAWAGNSRCVSSRFGHVRPGIALSQARRQPACR